MFTLEEKKILEQAAAIQESKARKNPVIITCCESASSFISNKIAHYEREVFLVVFLNSQNILLEAEILFEGSINQSMVAPREIIKRALQLNAKNIMVGHNHPSGEVTPSQSDIAITKRLSDACLLVDISLLDHFIIGLGQSLSFANKGLI